MYKKYLVVKIICVVCNDEYRWFNITIISVLC